MSWLITGVGVPLYDPDAAAYIAAVEAADQQSLEDSVKYTIERRPPSLLLHRRIPRPRPAGCACYRPDQRLRGGYTFVALEDTAT
jgi:hypothetical protein